MGFGDILILGLVLAGIAGAVAFICKNGGFSAAAAATAPTAPPAAAKSSSPAPAKHRSSADIFAAGCPSSVCPVGPCKPAGLCRPTAHTALPPHHSSVHRSKKQVYKISCTPQAYKAILNTCFEARARGRQERSPQKQGPL